jgi:hypothetical protein
MTGSATLMEDIRNGTRNWTVATMIRVTVGEASVYFFSVVRVILMGNHQAVPFGEIV